MTKTKTQTKKKRKQKICSKSINLSNMVHRKVFISFAYPYPYALCYTQHSILSSAVEI